ncbi:MAG: DUF1385 domain-containing protein [Anaerolineae bacterium]
MSRRFHYGGQAVLEGVMIRGKRNVAVAVRRPSGEILLHSEPLSARIYSASWGKYPFLRGLLLLWDTLALGMRSLMFSAEAALGEDDVKFGGAAVWSTLLFALGIGVAVFFLTPMLLVDLIDEYLGSSVLASVLEGLIRLGMFLIYVFAIGFLPDIRRVFAYHGAEHKVVNAYEDKAPLDLTTVAAYSTAHPRCGTTFLLTVMVIAILLFALLGWPSLLWRVLSRIAFVPLIAGLAYEFIRLTVEHQKHPLFQAIIAPGLALQSLTTREPDPSMLEVAIAAMEAVLRADEPT